MALAKLSNTSPMTSASPNCLISTPAGRLLGRRQRHHLLHRLAERHVADEIGADHDAAHAVVAVDGGRALRQLEARHRRQRHGGARAGRHLERFQDLRARRARRSSSCTRIGTCRSPTSNLARLAPMSPMVAMRTASEMASVETPSSAAMSVIGTTRSSGRSSSAVDTTLASSGMRLAWLVRSAAACADDVGAVAAGGHQLQLALAVVLQEPEADVGHAGQAAADLVRAPGPG